MTDPAEFFRKFSDSTRIKSLGMENSVMKEFFSDSNIKRLQRKLREEVFVRTRGKYRLDTDQDEIDLINEMRAVFSEYSENRDERPVHQVKELNKRLVDRVVPGMISNIEQYYGYRKDISTPLQPELRPTNVNGFTKRPLPSITTLWQ